MAWVPGGWDFSKARPAPAVATAPAIPPATNVYLVPSSLFPSNCTTPVDVSPNWVAWLATVPDGATIWFDANGCYGFGDGYAQAAPGSDYFGTGGAFPVFKRNNLTIVGNGSTFTALTAGGTHRNTWSFVQCTNVTLQNLTMVGPNPTFSPPANQEQQSPISIQSGSNITISNVTSTHSYGYHVATYDLAAGKNPTGTPAYPPPVNVTVTGCTFDNNGQQGIAFVCVAGATVSNCTITGCTNSVDIESSFANEITRDITVTGCTFSPNGNTTLTCQGYASGTLAYDGLPICRNIHFQNNVCTPIAYSLAQPFAIRSVDGVVIPGVVVSGNTFNRPSNGNFAYPCTLQNCSGFTFTNNTQHGAFNDTNFVLAVSGATGACTVTGNTIDGGQPGGLLYGLSGSGTGGMTLTENTNTNWPAGNNLS